MTAAEAGSTHTLLHLHPDRQRLAVAAGVAMVGLAAAAAAFPARTVLLIGAAGGWALWLAGALMLAFALVMFTAWLRLFGIVAALSAVGLGAYLTLNPQVGALATALLLAAALVMDGSFQLAASLHLRPLKAWRWLLASALTSAGAAGLLAWGAAIHTPQAVAFLLCAAFLTSGAALLSMGFAHAAPRR